MNIFCIHEEAAKSAYELPDQYIKSKMIIESAIMLQHCFSNETLASSSCPRTLAGSVRKSGGGYYNHPCSKWVRESVTNYVWLCLHAKAMCDERRNRFPNSKKHFTEDFIDWCLCNNTSTKLSDKGLTPFAEAFTKNSKCTSLPTFKDSNTQQRYRLYIKHDKEFATWTNTTTPEWYLN
jgi:hypothetical protein